MLGQYRGESPAKKFARWGFWLEVRAQLGKERFLEGEHLVLASAEAGDVSVLLGMGVKPRNIMAIDMDAGP